MKTNIVIANINTTPVAKDWAPIHQKFEIKRVKAQEQITVLEKIYTDKCEALLADQKNHLKSLFDRLVESKAVDPNIKLDDFGGIHIEENGNVVLLPKESLFEVNIPPFMVLNPENAKRFMRDMFDKSKAAKLRDHSEDRPKQYPEN